MTERDAILTLMDRVFDAVRSGDQEDWRALQLPYGTTISLRPPASGPTGAWDMRMTTNEAFVTGVQPAARDYEERWVGEPTVLIRGPMAVVWGEFDFWVDGVFSHCGVNAIDLVKVDGAWKVANLMWTTEREGCPTNAGD